jgi:LAO/AO transport system kinase
VSTEAKRESGGLIDRLLAGDTAALARALTLIDCDSPARGAVLRAARTIRNDVAVVGFTGAPGVGKSTVIGAYGAALRAEGRRVAILAVDPSSARSGGAVLGDRVRMAALYDDPGVFIRSIASRGHLGGLTENIRDAIAVVAAGEWETIVLETVGAGQSEIEVAEVADVNVVIESPGSGDDVQAIKAGILEIADVLVVNKADRPGADQTRRQLEAMLEFRATERARDVPIVSTVATESEGLGHLVEAIDGALAKLRARAPR